MQRQKIPVICRNLATLDDLATAAMLEDRMASGESMYRSASSDETGSTESSNVLAHHSSVRGGREGSNLNCQPHVGGLRKKLRSMNLRLEIPGNGF
jgi:hypothetical protein